MSLVKWDTRVCVCVFVVVGMLERVSVYHTNTKILIVSGESISHNVRINLIQNSWPYTHTAYVEYTEIKSFFFRWKNRYILVLCKHTPAAIIKKKKRKWNGHRQCCWCHMFLFNERREKTKIEKYETWECLIEVSRNIGLL